MRRVVGLIDATDEAVFGGKAAGLAACLRAGLRVPTGFAIAAGTTDADAIKDALAAEGLAGARLAVRSSAVGEDSQRNSFAGLLLSVMDVSTEDLDDAVAQVLASARRPEAIAYRRARDLPEDARVGVIVQELVPAEISGVMFTRDPINGRSELVVEAARGLGEKVVSGQVTPTAYRLDLDGKLVARRVAPGEPALDPASLDGLAELARRVDWAFPGGSDVEWASSHGELWVLQRRPITTSGT